VDHEKVFGRHESCRSDGVYQRAFQTNSKQRRISYLYERLEDFKKTATKKALSSESAFFKEYIFLTTRPRDESILTSGSPLCCRE
jgi:hypothetical protein